MRIKAILFDLDGTLLPMEQEAFAGKYIGGLVKAAAACGYNPEKMTEAILAGTLAMVKNNGEKTNEKVFSEVLLSFFGEGVLDDYGMFDEFYRTDFQRVKDVCGYTPLADTSVKLAKARGVRVVLATNPLFPSVATESRISWAGLDRSDFELITTYENSRYCKPSVDYYRDILQKINLKPCECLMVGNDVSDDMVASKLGMKTFLLTDCLINAKDEDITKYDRGGFDELIKLIETLETE